MVTVRKYLDESGESPFRGWFHSLDLHAAYKVTVALERIVLGHTSAIKSVGEGVSEYRIDFGPGYYRIYFGKDGDLLVILIGGGTKQRQQKDIAAAKAIWKEYKRRKQ